MIIRAILRNHYFGADYLNSRRTIESFQNSPNAVTPDEELNTGLLTQDPH